MRKESAMDTKIQISKAADDLLMDFVGKVNDGFTGGRVSRNQAASWVIMKMISSGNLERLIDDVRRDHFDEVIYLEHVVQEMKSAKRGGVESGTVNLSDLLKPLSSSKVSRSTSSALGDPAKSKQIS